MKQEIIAYYDRLAPTYDASRFANSYGRFIDTRERALLAAWLPKNADILELGCGTGRLSSFASVAIDASVASVAIARTRVPATRCATADAERLPFASGSFDAVFAFHLLMHLEPDAVRAVFAEAARVLRPGGTMIADVVSKTRRSLGSAQRNNEYAWHGATALTTHAFKAMAGTAGLAPARMTGSLLLPIHRFPDRVRASLAPIDGWLANRMPSLSSYLIGCFSKP